jgi:hypothetical protein
MQFMAVLSLSMSALVLDDAFDADNDDTVKRFVITVLSCILEFCLYVAVVVRIKNASVNLANLPELVSGCLPYRAILPGLESDAQIKQGVSAYVTKYLNAFGFTSKKNIILWSTLGLPVQILLDIISIGIVVGTVLGVLKFLPHCYREVSGVCSLAFWIGVTYCLVELQMKRNTLGEVLAGDYQDSQWGFGQVLALFAWAPFLVETIPGIVKSAMAFAKLNKRMSFAPCSLLNSMESLATLLIESCLGRSGKSGSTKMQEYKDDTLPRHGSYGVPSVSPRGQRGTANNSGPDWDHRGPSRADSIPLIPRGGSQDTQSHSAMDHEGGI